MSYKNTIPHLRRFYLSERRMPSYQELADILNITKRAAYEQAMTLVKYGILGKDEKGKLFPKSLFNIPVVGSVRAGYPQESIYQDESLDVFEFIHDATGDVQFIKVSGDSMEGAAILDGDYVVVDRAQMPKIGDIVAVCVDGGFTLKYFDKIEGKVALIPANPKYSTIYPAQELLIGDNYGGVVTLVLRKPRR